MRLLGIDTAIPQASVALVENGRVLFDEPQDGVADCENDGSRSLGKHAESLLPLIQSLLERAQLGFSDLSGLSISIGPGSFTGVRIGLATAKGIVYQSNLPLFGISTLEANAARAEGVGGLVVSLIDARKDEVYMALFRCTQGKVVRVSPDAVLSVTSAIELIRQFQDKGQMLLIGSGAKSYEREFREAFGAGGVKITCGGSRRSLAAQVALLGCARAASGATDDSGALAPVYLRAAAAERGIRN